jgi:hypothetical protein
MAGYDRSGRMTIEKFSAEPATGWTDPIAPYLDGMGGGISSVPPMLSIEPATIALELNEWIRFDNPGAYRVRVVSHRVTSVKGSAQAPASPVEVIANDLEITIAEPPSEWQKETLTYALKILDSARAPLQPGREAWESVKVLRYLGTPAAAQEMARRFEASHGIANSDSASWVLLFARLHWPTWTDYSAIQTFL